MDARSGTRRVLVCDVTTCAGLVVIVAATFLPWARSGRADRNAYAAVGLLQRLRGVHGWSSAAFHVLPFLALACAVVVASILVGHGADLAGVRIAGRVGAVAAAVAAIAGAAAALTTGRHFGVAPTGAGPGLALGGALVVVTACAWSRFAPAPA